MLNGVVQVWPITATTPAFPGRPAGAVAGDLVLVDGGSNSRPSNHGSPHVNQAVKVQAGGDTIIYETSGQPPFGISGTIWVSLGTGARTRSVSVRASAGEPVPGSLDIISTSSQTNMVTNVVFGGNVAIQRHGA